MKNQAAFRENPAAQKGGNTTSENLMKQNILSQILQLLSEDDTTTIESIQDTTNLNPNNNNNKSSMIKNILGQKPMGQKPMGKKPTFGQKPAFDQKPMGEKPMGDNLMDKSIFSKKPINNKEQFNPDKLLGNKKTDSDPLQKSINSDVDVYVPDCTAISNDILNNRIKQKNYLYLSPKCDKQIYNALINS